MKIGIQTWGSNGDIRPMIALANGLQNAGHAVTLVVSSIDNRNYSEECAGFNISYQQIPEYIDFDLESFAQQTFRMNTIQWLIALLDSAFFPYEDDIYQASRQLANTHDLVIGHHFLYPLKLAAYKLNKPFYSVTLCHAAIHTVNQPPFNFPDLGSRFNPLLWRLMDYICDFFLKKKLTKLWNDEGLPKIKHVFSDLLTSDSLNLVAVDPVFCPTYKEWRPQHHACGFLNLPTNSQNWQINAALQNFLDSGPAPIYMTFGSLQQAVPEWSMQLFIKATQLAGCRAIIQTSSARYPNNSQQKNIFFIGRHPHQSLFKHCAAIVHHGGAGTTHSASLCGRPSIVIPFMDEQLFWASTLERLGLASKPIPAQNATATLLASRINTILSSNSYQNNAHSMGAIISARKGVSNAVELIETTFNVKPDVP
ncbi:MAG: glycosyltransferase [Methylococcales bacterium]